MISFGVVFRGGGDRMMNGSADQQQLPPNPMMDLFDATIINDLPSLDQLPEVYDTFQLVLPESGDWNTSLISQVRYFPFFPLRIDFDVQ